MPLPSLLLLNKPFRVLTQFTSEDGKATLRDFVHAPGMRPAGRLDYDSEGLVLLTDSGALQTQLADPRWKQGKTYFVQVEGEIDEPALERLRRGVTLNDGPTLPADAQRVAEPDWLWPRDPPIRFRKEIPTSWLQLTIREGRNRQVRRMTAAVNFPTLRLIRYAVGPWTLAGLAPGESRAATASEITAFLADATPRKKVFRADAPPKKGGFVAGAASKRQSFVADAAPKKTGLAAGAASKKEGSVADAAPGKKSFLAGGASRPPRSGASAPKPRRSTQRRGRAKR